jgi:uncharacterized protein HemX
VVPIARARRRAAPLALAAGLLLAIGAAAGGYASHVNRVARGAAEAKERELAARQVELERLTAELERKRKEVAALQAEAAAARSDGERAALEAKLQRAREEQRRAQASIAAARGSAAPGGSASGAPRCVCQPLDPLCSCLE